MRWTPLLVLLTACDLPLEGLPVFEERWLVPVNSDSITLGQLLPPVVGQPTGDAITILGAVDPREVSLGDLCGSPCTDVSGTTAPKPAFTAEIATEIVFPIVSMELGTGTRVRVRVANDLGFDPVFPGGAAAPGQIVVTAGADGALLAADTIREALPSGGFVERILELPAGARVPDVVELRAHIVSPAGDAVPIDAARTLTLSGLAPVADSRFIPAVARSVRVVIESRAIESAGVPLRFDVDDTTIDRIKGAGVELAVENPLPVSGVLALRFLVGDEEIIAPKPVPLEPGNFQVVITLSEDEIANVLSTPFGTLQLTGQLTSTGEEVELTPTSAILIRARFGLIVEVGG